MRISDQLPRIFPDARCYRLAGPAGDGRHPYSLALARPRADCDGGFAVISGRALHHIDPGICLLLDIRLWGMMLKPEADTQFVVATAAGYTKEQAINDPVREGWIAWTADPKNPALADWYRRQPDFPPPEPGAAK
jgi:hypothetical protein